MYEYACFLTQQMLDGTLPKSPRFSLETAIPLVIIVLCHSSLEAYINEFLVVRKQGDAKWEAPITELQKANLHEKWALTAQILAGKSFDKGTEPYQSFSLLVTLRNELIHYCPEFLPVGTFPSKKVESLTTKFQFTHPGKTVWIGQVLNAECARWACRTVKEMTKAFHILVGNPDLTQIPPCWSDPP